MTAPTPQGTATQFGGPGKFGAAAISDALDMTLVLIRGWAARQLPPKLQRHALTAEDLRSGQVRYFKGYHALWRTLSTCRLHGCHMRLRRSWARCH